MTKKILIISHNEICYNPRLLKAADFFHSKKWKVEVFNPITGIASQEVYENCLKNRNWNVIENDISKRSLKSYLRWLFSSLIHFFISFFTNNFGANSKYYLNKGLILFSGVSKDYDYILVHLIDNLPFAVRFAKKVNAKVIYDSQEYFVGQYSEFEKSKFNWVKRNEEKYIHEVSILLATTNAMKDQLVKDYQFKKPALVVRNVPYDLIDIKSLDKKKNQQFDLELIWHGMWIYFENRRGLHIVLKAIAKCESNVRLNLQGKFSEEQRVILERYEEEFDLKGKVNILPPADPDSIVESLVQFEIGLTPELAIERNQELTSSNKLFDYIHAGLGVLSSDVIGLRETVNEFSIGLLFEPGNVDDLAGKIDLLARNKAEVERLTNNSLEAREQLTWPKEYEAVYHKMLEEV